MKRRVFVPRDAGAIAVGANRVAAALADAARRAEIAVEIVRKNPDQIGFAVNPRRWVVTICTMLPN